MEHRPELALLDGQRGAHVEGGQGVDAQHGHPGFHAGENGGCGSGAVRYLVVRVVRL